MTSNTTSGISTNALAVWNVIIANPKIPLRGLRYIYELLRIVNDHNYFSAQRGITLLSDYPSLKEFLLQFDSAIGMSRNYYSKPTTPLQRKIILSALTIYAMTYDIRELLNLTKLYQNECSKTYLISTAIALTITSFVRANNFFINLQKIHTETRDTSSRQVTLYRYRTQLEKKLPSSQMNKFQLSDNAAYQHLFSSLVKNGLYTCLGTVIVARNIKRFRGDKALVLSLKVLSLFASFFQQHYINQLVSRASSK